MFNDIEIAEPGGNSRDRGVQVDMPTSTSTLYSAPSYSTSMRRHCGCGGLLVGKRMQEISENKRKKGKIIIIIYKKKVDRKINMKKKRGK